MKRFLLFLVALLLTNVGWGQVANYNFVSSSGTYTAITGGTVLGNTSSDEQVFNNSTTGASVLVSSTGFSIGFNFTYNGVPFDKFAVAYNGYIVLGTGTFSIANSSSAAISTSSTSGYANVISPLNGDLAGQTSSELSYLSSGTAPNRVLTIQWKGVKRYIYGGTLNFQIKLFETTNEIQFIYGSNTYTNGTSSTYQVGLRGATNADVNTRSTTTNWSSTTAGTNSSTCTISSTLVPSNGLTYTFTPPPPCTVPVSLAASASSSAQSVTTINGSFTAAASAPTGYIVVRTTTNSQPTPVSGTTYTVGANAIGYIEYVGTSAGSWTSTALSGGTTYYYWVFSYNNTACSGGPLYSASATTFNTSTSACGTYSGTMSVGTPGTFANLTSAISDLTACGYTGNIILELQSTYVSTGETFPLTFTSALGSNASKTITIRPATGATGLSITSANTTGTIKLDGASYITFDGRPGGSGSKDMVIANTNLGTSYAVHFINDASNNIFNYCKINSRNNSTGSGTILFSTTTGANGNDNNTIDHCDIYDGTSTPYNAIYAYGSTTTTATYNSNNTISNCNIYNFSTLGGTSNGIFLGSGITDWTISGNSFYQTATRTATSSMYIYSISINNGFGNNFTITNNYIGGDSPNAAVTSNKWTILGAYSNNFTGIYVSVGSTTASNIQGNTISNISVVSTSNVATSFTGIYIYAGNVNVGTTLFNTIGSTTLSATNASSASIDITQSTNNGGRVFGINNYSSGVVNISNNKIGGFYLAASSTNTLGNTFYGIYSNYGTNTITSNLIGSTTNANSILSEGSKNTTANANTLTGIYVSSSGTNTISSNTIQNISYAASGGTGPSTGVTVLGIIASSGTNTISSNTVANLSNVSGNTGTTSTASVIGISMTSSTAPATVNQNTIYGLSNSHATAAVCVTGIHYGGPTTGASNLVARNLVYGLNIVSSSASSDMRGINFASGLATVQNNLIRLGYDASGAALTSGIQITGLFDVTSSANTGMYFNSVYIGGTGVNTVAGSTYAFRSNQTTNTRTYQNNIFYNGRSNATTGGKHYAIRVSGTGVNPSGLALNYNDYLANGTGAVFGYYNADVADFATWKTNVGQDANSINADPLFVAATATTPNLNLTTGSPCESVGLAIGTITDDYTGASRAGLTPTDMGAYAGLFAPAGIDMKPTAITSPTASGCYMTTETVTVTIQNNAGSIIDFTTNPVTVSVAGTNAAAGYNSSKIVNTGTLAVGGTMDVNMPATINMSANGTYSFDATTTVTGDINLANNALATVSRTMSAMGGTYTVGAAGTFTTLKQAVDTYNASTCLTGPVVFSLIDASYSAGETFPITINAHVSASATNTLTIKPAASVTTTISGTNATALLKLNGADYVIIDGSNNGTSTRNLTISNTNAGTSSAVVWLQTATADGATNNTIKNCILTGSGVTQTLFGIGSGSSTISTSSLGTSNNSNSFINNNISGTQYGIYSQGASSGTKNTGTIINQNVFNTSASAKGGIWVGFENNITISGNIISNIAQTSSPDVFGITLGMGTSNSATTSAGNEVTNATVSNNLIGSVVNSGTFSAVGIAVAAATSGTTVISNNIVSGVASNGTSGDFSAGIVLGGGTGSTTNLYYNTVSMQGAITGSTAASQTSACLAITNSTEPTVNIKNNIFYNTQIGNTSATLNFACIALAYSTYSSLVSDNNDLYCAGAGPGTYQIGITGTVVAGSSKTFATWQTATGKDLNSKSDDPLFVSSSDFTPTAPALNGTGVTIGSISVDYNNITRSTPPDIGAIEFTIAADDAGITTGVTSYCAGTQIVQVTLKNFGVATLTSVNIDWTMNGVAQIQKVVTGISLASGATIVIDLGTYNFVSATPYVLVATTSLPNGNTDINAVNDSYTSSSFRTALSGTYLVGTGQVYTKLTDAISAANTYGLCGPTIFSLIDATYPSETFPLVINAIAGASATNTLTIKPASGVSSTLSGSVASGALIKLNGADYITIDGSNSGGTDKSLTITNAATTAPSAIWLASLGTGTGCIYNTIKNCNLSTGVQTSLGYGVSISGTTISTAGADNDNVTIQNNTITNCAVGIYANGTTAVSAGANDNLSIVGNSITYNSTLSSCIGIQAGYSTSSTISQNTISVTTTASTQPVGISLETGFVSSTVTRNNIITVTTSATGGYGARGVTIGTGTVTSALTIANNLISGVNGSNYSGFSNSSSMGIAIGVIGGSGTMTTTAGGINLYNNTVNMSGSYTYAAACNTAALYIGSGASALDIRNNIFVNSLNNTNASGTASKNYAIYSIAPNTAFTNINNNNYFVSGAQGVLGFLTSDRTDLAGIISGFAGNANSINEDPVFTSTPVILTPTVAALDGTGVNGLVAVDYSNVARSNPPDIGALEFTPPSCNIPTALSYTGVTNNQATLNWLAASPAPGSGYDIYYSTSATTPDGTTIPTTSVGAGVVTYTTPTTLTAQTTYYAWIRSDCGAGSTSNWTSSVMFTTLCAPASSISESFDAAITPALPSCWTKYLSPSYSSETVTTITGTPNSSPNYVSLYSSYASAAADAPMLISPILSNLGAGTNQLRFFAKGASSNTSVIVGTMTDPMNSSTFTALQTVTGLSTSAWTEYIVSFASYLGANQYIAFRHPLTTTYSYIYLDNVVWELTPTPTISSLGSASGCVGSSLVITGTNLSGATSVTIGGTAATITGTTATTVTVTVESGPSGVVTVTTGGGVATSASSFTVNQIPATPGAITSNSPQCSGTGVTFTKGACTTGTCYWVTLAAGTETTNSAATNTTATTVGTYNVWVRAESNGCWSLPVTASGIVNQTPSALTVTPSTATICQGTSQSLVASGGVAGANFTFGTAVTTNTTTGYPAPYTNYDGGNKHQMLILASELTAAGLTAGSPVNINSVSFTIASVGSSFGGSLSNFQISMKNATANTLGTTFKTGMTLVYGPLTQAIPTTGLPATVTHNITPFTWNGADNLLIETSYSNANTGSSNTCVQMRYSNPGFSSTTYYSSDGATAATILASTTGTAGNPRPNMILNISVPSPTTWSPTTDLYTNAGTTTAYTGTNLAIVYTKPTANRTYTATATATGGCTSTATATITYTPTVGTPVFTLGATSTRCQGASGVTYGATATNNTSIVYSLDVTTAAYAGNAIVPSTGAVTYAAGWSGTTTVTATAYGCNGSSAIASHVVTVTSAPTATISYDGSPYNTTEVVQSVTFSGTSGGVYSSLPAGLSLNATTGDITPSASTPNTYTVKYTVAAAGGCSVYEITTSVQIVSGLITTFTGTGNWNVAGRWDNGIPTAVMQAFIAGHCTLTTSGVCNNLTINPAFDLTVNTGQTLTINGQFTIKSSAAGTGSYINNGTVTYGPTPKVERYISQGAWHYITSPVQTAVSGTWLNVYLKDYNEATNGFNPLITPLTIPMTVGKGFALWSSASTTGNVTRTYTGTLNEGDKVLPLQYSGGAFGYNLIGNVFTSAITPDINNWTRNSVDPSLWVWNAATGNYQTWNASLGTGTLSGTTIPASQGFLVHATGAGASVTIMQAKRVHSADPYHKDVVNNNLLIRVAGNNYADGLVVNFYNDATNDYDKDYDLEKINGMPDAPQISTLWSGKRLSINVVPEIVNYTVMPMSFNCTASGTFNLSAEGISTFTSTLPIRLKDMLTNQIVDLRQQTSYQFTHEYDSTSTAPRFNLIFGMDPTGISEDEGEISVYANESKIIVSNPMLINLAQIAIYNNLGQLVKMLNSPNTLSKTEIDVTFAVGTYIVKTIDTKGNSVVKKVIIL